MSGHRQMSQIAYHFSAFDAIGLTHPLTQFPIFRWMEERIRHKIGYHKHLEEKPKQDSFLSLQYLEFIDDDERE